MLRWEINERTQAQLKQLLQFALSPEEARLYHLLHDCGKPSCLTIDEAGRRHFPGHAEASELIFRQYFPDREEIARLIGKDMLCHTLRGDDAKRFAIDPDASTLCLTAWAELHSNAEKLFGGFGSDSFKIKRKRLEKLTEMIAGALSSLQSRPMEVTT